MTTYKLDAEEQEMQDSYESGEWQSIAKVEEELRHYQAYAAVTIGRNKLVGISLSPEDFEGLHQKAREMGIPYQALIANIVHQFVAGRLVEQP